MIKKLTLFLMILLMAAPVVAQAQQPNKSIQLTPKEETWLHNHKTIRVGMSPVLPPLKFSDKGVIKGIEPDYLNLLSEYTGIHFEYVICDFSVMDAKVNSGELDMFISFYIPERLAYMTFTEPVMDFKQVIITRSEAPFMSGIGALKGKKVATLKGVKLYEKLLSPYPEIEVIQVGNTEEMFRAVSESKADALISRIYIAGYVMQNYPNLKIAGFADLPPEPFLYAVRKDYPELVGILNKAIETIPKDRFDAIIQKWFTIRLEYRPNWSEIRKWAFAIGAVFTLILGLSLFWNRRLAGEIDTRKRAEESLREKSDYLDKLIGYANAPIIVWDSQCIVTRFNHAFEDLTGLKAEEVLGKNMDLLFPEERREECLGHVQQTIGGARWEVIEIPILHQDGTVRTVLWSSATIYSPDGKTATATIAQGQDITDRKRMQEENERRARQLTVLHETSVELTAELNLDALLHSIVQRALNLIGGASCNCYLRNPQTDLMERVATAGTALVPSPKTRHRGEGMVGQVWATGSPLLVNDYRSWSGRTRAYDSFPSRAVLAVPFRSGTEILGVLNIMAPLPHQYTEVDVEVLDLFAAQAAIAIRNARIHDRLETELADRRRAEQQVQRQSKLLAAINSVFFETLTASSTEEVARTCLKVAQEITDSKFCFLGEITPEGLYTTTALSDPGWEACRIPETQALALMKNMVIRGIWGQVILKEQSLIVNDPVSFPDRVGTPEGHPPLTSFLGVPLIDQRKVIGIIALANSESGYTADHQRDMEALCVAFVEAIRRKKAEKEIIKLNTELEQRVIERTAQLKASNRELEAFSYSVSHDLRAPLRSIDGFSEALLEEYPEKLDDTGKAYLARVRKATQRMGFLIDDMLKLSRITQAEMKREAVDLSGMIREIAEAHQRSNPDRAFDVAVQEGIVVQGDPYLIKIAMENLVDNAFKFTGREAHPRIEFGAAVRDGETACSIRDNGAGFDMAYAGKLFGAFQRLHTTDEFPGTGIGLATVQRIIHRHGGRIWAEGEVGKGVTFSFTLP